MVCELFTDGKVHVHSLIYTYTHLVHKQFTNDLVLHCAPASGQFISMRFADMNHTKNVCGVHTSIYVSAKNRQILVHGVWYTNCMQMVQHMFVVHSHIHIWHVNHTLTVWCTSVYQAWPFHCDDINICRGDFWPQTNGVHVCHRLYKL